jgi:hypothetical protein
VECALVLKSGYWIVKKKGKKTSSRNLHSCPLSAQIVGIPYQHLHKTIAAMVAVSNSAPCSSIAGQLPTMLAAHGLIVLLAILVTSSLGIIFHFFF